MVVPVVTIIVPVYNAGQYLGRCIDSLLNQTYNKSDNLDIIVIDDGSSDNTQMVGESYAKAHSNVNYYRTDHVGVSSARNYGLDLARGKYVMFTDGDDYAEREYVEKMVHELEADDNMIMSVCSYNRIIWNRSYSVEHLIPSGIRTSRDYLVDTLKNPGHHYFGVVWNKIFRMDIIRELGLKFKDYITLGEDFVFGLEYLRHSGYVSVIDDKLYNYCYGHSDSLSRVLQKEISDCRDEMNNRKHIFEEYVKSFQTEGIYNKYEKIIYRYWIVFYNRQLYSCKHDYKWNSADINNWMSELENEKLIIEAKKIVSPNYIRRHYYTFMIDQSLKKRIKKIIHLFSR